MVPRLRLRAHRLGWLLLVGVAGFDDVEIGVATEVGQADVGTGVPGVCNRQTVGGQAHACVRYPVRQRAALQPERPEFVGFGGKWPPVKNLIDR
jgi:hypothetical protein